MWNRTTILVLVFFFFIFVCGAGAQDIYFRNKPFKGAVSGSWDSVMVDLQATAKIFELELRQEAGVFLVGDSQATGASAGQVVVNGKVVPSEAGETGPMVDLKGLAQAAGLTYKSSKDLGTIDVSKPAGKGTISAPGYAAESGKPILLNQETPGQDMNLDELAVSGKVTLIFFYYTTYEDRSYREKFHEVDELATLPGVVLYKVNAGSESTALGRKYPGNYPRLYYFDRHRRFRNFAGGHGITFKGMKPIIEKMQNEP